VYANVRILRGDCGVWRSDGFQRLSDLELDEMQANDERIKTMWSDRNARKPSSAIEK
jgi:hypothetical protein